MSYQPARSLVGIAVTTLFTVVANAADTNPSVQAAQDQAAIAQANATAANAQMTAQQAVIASQLANQKTDIANIQAALTGFDPSKLRLSSNPTAPSVNAVFNKIMGDKVTAWVADKTDNPVADVSGCDTIFMARQSLLTSIQVYKGTGAKLDAIWQNVSDAAAAINKVAPKPKPPAAEWQVENFIGLPVVAGLSDLATLVADFAASAKQLTGVSSTPQLTPMSKVVVAAVEKGIVGAKKEFYDSDATVDYDYDSFGTTDTCSATTLPSNIKSLSLMDKAACTGRLLDETKAMALGINLDPKPDDPKAHDPQAAARDALAALTKVLGQATTDFQNLFLADSTGNIPINLAVQGEQYNTKLKQPKACILNVSALTADADTVAVDGTFTTYKLSVATTTTISWTVATPKGLITKSGLKVLSTDWTTQNLDSSSTANRCHGAMSPRQAGH